MAKAQEGCGGAGSLEAELTCPICLGLYRDPVSLICGHNFCRQCIENVLLSGGTHTCPSCRADLGPTVRTQKNFQLGSIVDKFQATTSKAQQARREDLRKDKGCKKGKTGVVPCEYCLDGPQPAVKTCLVCEASLCQAHLSKHNAKASQQDHILVEVGAGKVEERRCPEHGKLLECYCLREDKCICVLCSIAGAHKGHEVITMKEERDKQLVKLSETTKELQKFKRDIVTALDELQKCENPIKANTKTVTSELEELFKNIKTELAEKEKMILSDIQSREKAELALIAEERKKMENRKQEAEQNLQALQKIKEQPDVFLFFKDLKVVTDRIASLDLGTRIARVQILPMDQCRTARFQRMREDLMCQLNWELQDVQNDLNNQVQWSSEASAPSPYQYKCAASGLSSPNLHWAEVSGNSPGKSFTLSLRETLGLLQHSGKL